MYIIVSIIYLLVIPIVCSDVVREPKMKANGQADVLERKKRSFIL